MGLFDFIFGKPIIIEHEFFGTMQYSSRKKFKPTDYYYCKKSFSPTNDIIELFIDSAVEGPTQTQIDFFKTIELKYPEFIQSIIPLIETEFQNWKEDFKIQDFRKEFVPVFIQLPRCTEQPYIWEIAFNSDHDKDHCFSVSMRGLEAESVLIDG